MTAHRKFARLDVGETSWLIAEGYQEEALFAAGFQWSHGRLIRATPHRRALQVEGKHRSFLVKHFVVAGLWLGLKRVVRGSPAAREWKALHEAQLRGLSVPPPVALGEGEKIWQRESLLVTEFVGGAVPLGHYLFGPDRPIGSTRQRVVQEIAKLIRHAHDSGFYQPDLHLDNILVRPGLESSEFFLIDLQRVIFRSSLSLRRRWRNLSVLNGGCAEASLTDRVCFLKDYLSSPSPLTADFRKVTARLERAGQKHRLRLWQSRGKRCLAENREFLKVKAGDFFGFARRDTWSDDFQGLTDGLDQHLAGPGIPSAKASPTMTAGLLEFHGIRLRVKKHPYRGYAYAFIGLVCCGPARRAWVTANYLRMRGISVPLPIAYLEKRRFRMPVESYIITKEVSGKTLSDVFARLPGSGLSVQEKRRLLADFARFVARMHSCGVACGDLRASSFVVEERTPGKYDLHAVDFDGVRLGTVSWRRRIANLARLTQESYRYACFTQRDRLRFLKAYLGREKDKSWRRVWSRVAWELTLFRWRRAERRSCR
jgi:tRNA A-37 threonylcarbamoyl transferase component Bud32